MRAVTNSLIRRPGLAAAALLALAGTALLPTPAVPVAIADAAVKTGSDAGKTTAENLAVQAVLRVMGPTDGPSIRGFKPGHRTMTTT